MDNCLICKYDSKNEILGSVCRSALGIDNSGKNDGFTIHFASPKYVFSDWQLYMKSQLCKKSKIPILIQEFIFSENIEEQKMS